MVSPEYAAALAALVSGLQRPAELARLFPRPAPDVAWTAVDAGGAPAEWVTAGDMGEDGGAFLYLHGGGYTEGSPASHRELVSRLVRHAGAPALSVDYRLAPQHPYPAALDDAIGAWTWLSGRLGPDRVAIVGDSAGGGLALALAMWLRDHGRPGPAMVAALCPWTDLSLADAEGAQDPLIDVSALRERGRSYLGAADPRTPYASPLHGRMEGLPPLFLHAGDCDVLKDDAARFAARAAAAGAAVEFEAWPGMTHVWHALGDAVPEARDATRRAGAAIGAALRRAAA